MVLTEIFWIKEIVLAQGSRLTCSDGLSFYESGMRENTFQYRSTLFSSSYLLLKPIKQILATIFWDKNLMYLNLHRVYFKLLTSFRVSSMCDVRRLTHGGYQDSHSYQTMMASPAKLEGSFFTGIEILGLC